MGQIHTVIDTSVIDTLKANGFKYIEGIGCPTVRVYFNDKYGVSISQAFLSETNNHERYNESAVETALLLNDEIHYDDHLEYHDVRRFSTLDELVVELNRLKAHFIKLN
jgi:hypothetical protein